MTNHDEVNHPNHYTSVVPGIECIEVVEHFGFLRGSAIKYLWRAGLKGDIRTDLEKARWYINREIMNLDDLALEEEDFPENVLCVSCEKGDHGDCLDLVDVDGHGLMACTCNDDISHFNSEEE